ncbi:hypothetical protein LSH36_200g02293 [Paralvinella palmiformis]|uniref:SUEL-type lectin domain-containing protein n=1 Tax=Paralvinella palmiformis TaxID=53620 RepID=A0AAD9JPV8_9ANNE|nr:hypothetical protein LSH36_200g02293 [Paralvinella palmiformis]
MIIIQYPLLVLAFGMYHVRSVRPVTVDVCTGYDFRASCKPDEIIVMESAEFGRMGPGKCISGDRGNFGCKNDVLFLADLWCSGRKDCQFNVPNAEIMEAKTECVDLLAFLRASYSCVIVTYNNQKRCSSSSPNVINAVEGIISSHLTRETGCGSIRKTLNINQTICGQNTREDVIYRSKTNTVEIQLRENIKMNFLIKYKTNGCSDPVPPLHAWYKRNGNEAVIGCENSDREWRLTCLGNNWQGKSGNCTQSVTTLKEPDTPVSGQFQLSTIVIVAGIIGGTIVLAVAVVVCGVVYIQKYKGKMEKRFNEQQAVTNGETLPQATTQTHYRLVSTTGTEGQDEYLQPNTNTQSHKPSCKPEEPLIHIWETPLPNPTADQTIPRHNECTIHRNNGNKQNIQNPSLTKKGTIRSGTSYYSPNTGHKYYVVDRDK